jgi:hypothetical protein
MVQNGKLAASALLFEIALNNVDLPTFGNPTIPHFNPIPIYLLEFWRKDKRKSPVRKFEQGPFPV